MKRLFFLLLAAALVVPAAARADERTNVDLINATGHFIYVDTYHLGSVQHWGLKAPGARIAIHIYRGNNIKFFTDVYVYVKKTETEEASQTICHVMKSFGNTDAFTTITEHVHYDGKSCWISPT